MKEFRERITAAARQIDKCLADCLPFIDPLRGATPEEYLFRCKCFNELAGYVSWRERLGTGETPQMERLRAHVLERIDADYLALCGRDPQRILTFSAALSYSLHRGVISGQRAEFARRLLSTAFAWSAEYPPHRQLDLLHACRLAGLDDPVDCKSVLAVSSLVVAPSPIYATREAFYALTHSSFYAWVIGISSGLRSKARLHDAIEGGMCRAIAVGDVDLGLELVTSAQLLGLNDTPAQRILVGRTVDHLTDGKVLSARRSIAIKSFVESCPRERGWAEMFHVTYVAGLALSSVLHFGRLSADAVEAPRIELVARTGEALEAFHRYRWVEGLMAASKCVSLGSESTLYRRLLNHIGDFIEANGNTGGEFGCFFEERSLYARVRHGGDFRSEITTGLQERASVVLSGLRAAADDAEVKEGLEGSLE